MPRYAYVNGRYVPHRHAMVHIEDRGFQLADGVYEVIPVCRGYAVDLVPHLTRLTRSLAELQITMPIALTAIELHCRELIRRNGTKNGIVYIQVTRGSAPREHKFPRLAQASLVVTTQNITPISDLVRKEGVRVITIADQRWARCDIKSISLLPNVLGKQAAHVAGVFEAWMVDRDGMVTEGTSSNAWIIQGNQIRTRPLGSDILAGIVRQTAQNLAQSHQMHFREDAFSVPEALGAREAFLTSTTSGILSIREIDGNSIGSGKAGPIALQLHRFYEEHIERQTATRP